jgi:hypothetical protein
MVKKKAPAQPWYKKEELFNIPEKEHVYHFLVEMLINIDITNKEEREKTVAKINKTFDQTFDAVESKKNDRDAILSKILNFFFDTVLSNQLLSKDGKLNVYTIEVLTPILKEVGHIYKTIGIDVNHKLFEHLKELKDFKNFQRVSGLKHIELVNRICTALKCICAVIYNEKIEEKTPLIKDAFQKYLDEFKKLRALSSGDKMDDLEKSKIMLEEEVKKLTKELKRAQEELSEVDTKILKKKKTK